MKLINFELSEPSFAIELVGLGLVLDLHNSGTFLGIKVDPGNNATVMRWMINGRQAVKCSACDLVFRGLKLMIISPRDDELPFSEDLCVSGISKIVPGVEKPEYRTRRQWEANAPFNLLFEFQSKRSIEINAESVELSIETLGQ